MDVGEMWIPEEALSEIKIFFVIHAAGFFFLRESSGGGSSFDCKSGVNLRKVRASSSH